jgi:hypothetical protein
MAESSSAANFEAKVSGIPFGNEFTIFSNNSPPGNSSKTKLKDFGVSKISFNSTMEGCLQVDKTFTSAVTSRACCPSASFFFSSILWERKQEEEEERGGEDE